MCTRFTPSCRRALTRVNTVVPRMMESSMMMISLPLSSSLTGLSFTRTAKSRMGLGGLNEGPADVMVADHPQLIGKAGFFGITHRGIGPESGNGMTKSASTGASRASRRPKALRMR